METIKEAIKTINKALVEVGKKFVEWVKIIGGLYEGFGIGSLRRYIRDLFTYKVSLNEKVLGIVSLWLVLKIYGRNNIFITLPEELFDQLFDVHNWEDAWLGPVPADVLAGPCGGTEKEPLIPSILYKEYEKYAGILFDVLVEYDKSEGIMFDWIMFDWYGGWMLFEIVYSIVDMFWTIVFKIIQMFITQEEINEECLRIFQMEFANQVESKNKQHTIALIRPHVREVDEGGIFSPESFARHHKPISSAFTSSWREDAQVDVEKIQSYIEKNNLRKIEKEVRYANISFDYAVYNVSKKKWNDIIAEGYICIDIDREPLMFAILPPVRMTRVVMLWIQGCLEAKKTNNWEIWGVSGDYLTWQMIMYQKVTSMLLELWLPKARFAYDHDFECQPTEGAYFFSLKFEPIDIQLIERSTKEMELPIRDFMRYLLHNAGSTGTTLEAHYVRGPDWWGLRIVTEAHVYHQAMNYSLLEFEANNDWANESEALAAYYGKKIWLTDFEVPDFEEVEEIVEEWRKKRKKKEE